MTWEEVVLGGGNLEVVTSSGLGSSTLTGSEGHWS